MSSSPHFAHGGIIEAARELVLQLDNLSEDGQADTHSESQENAFALKERGLLAKLLGPGGECEGYLLRFVGHSLGGSIAALTALRFCGRYPQVHAYGYGILPCVDASVADTCSDFVTSIVYNDEFSSRLSISSIKRLRIAAVKALASEPSSDFGIVTKLARRLLGPQQPISVSVLPNYTQAISKEVAVAKAPNKHKARRFNFRLKGGIYLCSHACHCMIYMSRYSSSRPPKNLLNDFAQCRPQSSHSLKIVSKGLNGHAKQASADALTHVESFVLIGDGERHASSRTVNDGLSDKENVVCVNAGGDGYNDDEETEVFVINDNVEQDRHPSTLHTKPEEDVKHSIGAISSMVESGQTGTAPVHSESNAYVQIPCAGHLEEQHDHCEMFMPGLIVHIVPANQSSSWPSWDFWGKKVQQACQHRAFIKNRKDFKDLVISASMFLDHMPWRCQYALNHVLELDKATSKDMDNCTDLLV